MRKSIMMALGFGVAALVAIYFARSSVAQDRKADKHAAWEYKVLTAEQIIALTPKPKKDAPREKLREEETLRPTGGLNVLGADGWELVGVGFGELGGPFNQLREPVYIFKRPT